MQFDKETITPPGQHPHDPSKGDIDPLGYALERLQTYLIWSDEHRASYEKARNTNLGDAENELNCLKNSIERAIIHLQRLSELLLAGYGVDSKKKLPNNLCGEVWNRIVQNIEQQRQKDIVQ